MGLATVIVEDEYMGRVLLRSLIEEYCPSLEVVGEAENVKQAKDCIAKLQPNLVFLDIYLPDGDGFNILEHFSERQFEVIFTTAHQDQAFKAFEYQALQYLLKPVEIDSLQQAVRRVSEYYLLQQEHEQLKQQITEVGQVPKRQGPARLPVMLRDEILFFPVEEIIRCEADSNYTHIFLTQQRKIMASKSLLHYEKSLLEHNFFRVHDKHLINLAHVAKYLRGQGGQILLSEGHIVDVSTRRRDNLLQKLL